jgi:hypothetical protein
VADELPISYDKRELRSIISAFKAMDDEAVSQAKRESSALATYAANEIKAYGLSRTFGQEAVRRITTGVKVSASSKIGEFSYGSNRLRQFPRRTPSKGRGNAGYFIYPTLRKIQPELINKWQEAFSKILKEWDK